MKKWLLFTPLLIVFAISILLFIGLHQDPKKIASALIGKPVPEFYQADLFQPEQLLTNRTLPKKPFLLNVWGSWCHYCKQEHPLLNKLAEQGVAIVGLNYRDKAENARLMLQQQGNPFVMVIDDAQGKFALQLGVDGAPETYLVDEQGIIRYRYEGMIDEKIWLSELKPKLEKLIAGQTN